MQIEFKQQTLCMFVISHLVCCFVVLVALEVVASLTSLLIVLLTYKHDISNDSLLGNSRSCAHLFKDSVVVAETCNLQCLEWDVKPK